MASSGQGGGAFVCPTRRDCLRLGASALLAGFATTLSGSIAAADWALTGRGKVSATLSMSVMRAASPALGCPEVRVNCAPKGNRSWSGFFHSMRPYGAPSSH